MCAIMALLGLHSYFVHQLSQLFLAWLLIDVYETIVIHSAKPLRLQRYNIFLIYASFLEKNIFQIVKTKFVREMLNETKRARYILIFLRIVIRSS